MPLQPAIALKLMRSHFLSGRETRVDGLAVRYESTVSQGPARKIDMNGSYFVGQIYAQEYRLIEPRHPWPVLLWHGGGMTGAQWEATPDGRVGWLWHFLQAGYDVFVTDAPERGRASWTMFPHIYTGAPIFRSKEEAWRIFRIGADYTQRRPHPGQQFPVEAFNTFARQFVPRWLGHEDLALDGYRELLALTGPAIIIAHSQAGGFAARLATEQPAAIAAVIGLEPTGMPRHAPANLPANTPAHLLVWGDHFTASPLWQTYRRCAETYHTALRKLGVKADDIDLPSCGLPGNSHFCMLDRNSEAVAARVITWLADAARTPSPSLCRRT